MTAGSAATSAARERQRQSRPGTALARPVQLVAIVSAVLLGLPIVVVIGRAVLRGSLASTPAQAGVVDALVLSLVTTLVTIVLMVLFGTPLALVLARGRFRGQALVETLIDLPIVLPPSVAGLALLLVFGRRGLLGEPLAVLGIELPFTTIAVVIAQLFVATPFYVRSARTGFASVDHDLEDAARVDGASERQLFSRVTVPLAASALAAGLVMSWARALGEFGATIMFAGNVAGRTQTLPLLVYGEFQSGDLDASIAGAAVLVLAAFGVLVAVRLLHWGRVLEGAGSA